jgi:hypothetical protein
MNAFAQYLARHLWGAMLWLMRRPWIKWLQRKSWHLFPDRFKPRARRSLNRQNRFARRYGLRMLTATLSLFLASIAVTACFMFALYLIDSGALTVPEDVRARADTMSSR